MLGLVVLIEIWRAACAHVEVACYACPLLWSMPEVSNTGLERLETTSGKSRLCVGKVGWEVEEKHYKSARGGFGWILAYFGLFSLLFGWF